MKLIPKKRIIYSNYDLWEVYPDDLLKQIALECGWVEDESEITENDLINWRYEESETDWECVYDGLKRFFADKTVGFFGQVGLWHGVYNAGKVGDFEDLFCKATTDCDYVEFYDENGHLFLTCSHHDGTHHFEIKIVTDKGTDYLDRWEDNENDKRTEEQVNDQIFKRFSKVPNYCHKEYGSKKKEYEPQSKERFKEILQDKATSNYYPNGYAM